jgi:hypothetical protein
MDVVASMEKSQTRDDLVADECFVTIGQDERIFNEIAQWSPFAIPEEQSIFVDPLLCYQILMET